MANYKQDVSPAWLRSKQVIITNEYKEVPSIKFLEEFIVEHEGKVMDKTYMGEVQTQLKNPLTAFDLLHPDTDAKLGEAKFQDVYVMLYSLYRFLGAKRDITVGLQKIATQCDLDVVAATAEVNLATIAHAEALALSNATPEDTALATEVENKLAIKITKQATLDSLKAIAAAANADVAASVL